MIVVLRRKGETTFLRTELICAEINPGFIVTPIRKNGLNEHETL